MWCWLLIMCSSNNPFLINFICKCELSYRAGFHFQFSGDINQHCVWILCNDFKSWWRRIWRSWSSPPRRAFCFYNSISGILTTFQFSLYTNSFFFFFFRKGLFCYQVQSCKIATNPDSWLPFLFLFFSACLDSRIQLGTLLIGEQRCCIHEITWWSSNNELGYTWCPARLQLLLIGASNFFNIWCWTNWFSRAWKF